MTIVIRVLAVCLLPTLVSCAGSAVAQEDLPEKRVIFYNTYGYDDAESWKIPMRIWVYEEPDFIRNMAARVARIELQRRAGIEDLLPEQQALFAVRTHGFIADSESGENVVFRFDGDPEETDFRIVSGSGRTSTDRNGLVEGVIEISHEKAELLLASQRSTDGWLSIHVTSENHGGTGRIRLIPREGVSLVSDVDDTIKVTQIPAGEQAVLRNTFFDDFRTAPCMSSLYGALHPSTGFHYVSGGPWQLYAPLSDFLFSPAAGFPAGSFHMKDVRTNPFESESYQDIWRLVASGSQQVTFAQKVEQISTLLEHFPLRQFILVGDSGEMDPEIFSHIRDQFPGRIDEVRIRDVVDAADNEPARLAGMTVIRPSADADGSCRQFQVSATGS